LAALLWDDDPPPAARATLNTHMSRLRRWLDPHDDGSLGVRLVNRQGGYLAEVDPQTVDAHRFRALVERARMLTEPTARSAGLREALALWRGPLLADAATPWLRERIGTDLTELRMSATELAIDADLAGGRQQDLIGELTALTAEHPYRERFTAQLMLALYRCDRSADALAAFARLRARLAQDLGVDPEPELGDLHTAILRRDPQLTGRRTTASVPRQLPAAPRWFTGRAGELASLTKALTDDADHAHTVVVSAIGGAGGVGKTWLALHWAHQHLDRFPDGQLFVNLRGFDPSGKPATPAAAIRGFLDALGAMPGDIPADLSAQVGLYRSLVAGRRMLIVLDNARDAAQVVDLLPGSATCTVIVTSRDRLTAVVSGHGADPLPLDLLHPAQARDLLARRLGEERLAGEPAAAQTLIAGCGGLPLALGIVAARAMLQPELDLSVIASELHDAASRLGALDDGDPQTGLRAVLSWSYQALEARDADVFGLLGLAPGPDVSLPAVAALAGRPAAEVTTVLRVLAQQSLVQQHSPGRWRMHDLIRLYAAEQAHRNRPQDRNAVALHRLVDFYLHSAAPASQLLDPHRPSIALAAPAPGCEPLHPTDETAALAWLDAEHPALLAAQQLAAEQGWHDAAWQLAWALDPLHGRRGHLHDNVAVWRTAMASAQRAADPTIAAMAHRRLGNALVRAGHHPEAIDHLGRALALAEAADDRPGRASTHLALAQALEQQGDNQRALDHATQSLELYRSLRNPVREAGAHNTVGWYLAQLGRHDQALGHLEAALVLARRHHHLDGEANTLDSLGYLAHHTGRHTKALHHYRQALALYRDLGNAFGEADTLERLGLTYVALGDREQARRAWQQAFTSFSAQQRSSEAARARRQLDDLDQPGPTGLEPTDPR
jgi:DNA-binding SARP family transcriptional activator/tetratricopeptide (TPR) repeat protein